MVLEGLKTQNVSLAWSLLITRVTPNLCDPLPPGPGTRRLVKVSSTGTESSDDFEERDPDLGDGLENGSGSPFRKWTLSSAAQTHRLRRLRGPAKCRECEAFMVSGTECEEVWPEPITQCPLLTPMTSPTPCSSMT